MPPPIALIVFNRPDLAAQLYTRIRAIKPSRLLIIADGPRMDRPDDLRLCAATRKIVSSPDWPCELQVNFAEENLGNGRRISSGLDWVFEECSEAIILEDDCMACPSFFSFCSEMLDRYRDDTRVMHISGNNFQGGVRRGDASYYFSRYAHSWGWATWRRAWKYYDLRLSLWPNKARTENWLTSIFSDPLEIEYWTDILNKTYNGLIDTWDYPWMFTCWCQNGLSILPNENLVSNIGSGPDATHFKNGGSTIGIATRELDVSTHPGTFVPNREADRFTFKEHIAPKKLPLINRIVPELRARFRLRTRLKGLALPRPMPNVLLPYP
jgi:hypothetical protein